MINLFYRLQHIMKKYRRKPYRMKSESGRGERKWITVGEAITGIGITETEIGTGKTDTITERGMTIEIAGNTSCIKLCFGFIYLYNSSFIYLYNSRYRERRRGYSRERY